MDSYRIEFSRSAEKDLRRIDRPMIPRITQAIYRLGAEPRPAGVRKLAGSDNAYRIRVGDYRVIYTISDILQIIGVERIRHRREVYD